MYAYLLELDAWTGSAVQTLRLATHTIVTTPTDTPANTVYDGRIIEAGSFSRSLVSSGRLGRATASWGLIELANADGGLDSWLDYGVDGRRFVLKTLPARGMPVAQATTLFSGTLAALESGSATDTLRLRIRDRLAELSVPLLTQRYAGTTTSGGLGIEGDADLQDQLKPRIFGSVTNIAPKLANKFDLIYQVSSGPVSAIVVYDGGLALTNVGDYPALSSMMTATVSPGQFVTCNAQGVFRLGGTPVLTVTADAVENATDLSASGIVSRMMQMLGYGTADVDSASLVELAAFNPATLGLYVDSESTAIDLIGQVLGSVGAAIVPSTMGVFQAIGLAAPTLAASIGALTLRDLAEGGTFTFGLGPDDAGVPAWSVVLNYGRVWQTLTEGQLAGAVSADLARRTFLAAQWRQATAENASTKTVHLLASQLTADTFLTTQSAAQAEANRLLALYGVRRDLIRFPTDIDRASYDLGDVVTLTLPRFGYTTGRPMLVVGRHDDADKRTVTLELWGFWR